MTNSCGSSSGSGFDFNASTAESISLNCCFSNSPAASGAFRCWKVVDTDVEVRAVLLGAAELLRGVGDLVASGLVGRYLPQQLLAPQILVEGPHERAGERAAVGLEYLSADDHRAPRLDLGVDQRSGVFVYHACWL